MKFEIEPTEYDEIFKEDLNLCYEVAESYVNLNSENYAGAFELSKNAWILADRGANLSAEASKLALSYKVGKTDLKDFCYRKYKLMEYIHEMSRIVWRYGQEKSDKKYQVWFARRELNNPDTAL
ncbi:hypothetical protein CPJCM30710_25430 [Clostridium polyendosporum]|uniref:Uncharacterized protein n=1 Tax=Clostridium polyendosporum TaxID=69208 RepID=A0A919S0I1_9CLOT|nr:hypothetical protein [Clostridium polyendosporum]GIM29877.1 hypothetical protein CPJCM30710_25430 [Clostridium polyendosporum]